MANTGVVYVDKLPEQAVLATGPVPLVAQVESLRDGLDELRSLLPQHYVELSGHRERGYELSPDYREYLFREDAGQLLYVALREGRTLVGYYVGFVTRCLHYHAVTLTMDVFYVMPGRRGLDGGNALLDEVEREATRRGVDPSKIGFKESHSRHMEALLRSRGYEPFERTYVKWLVPAQDSEDDNVT